MRDGRLGQPEWFGELADAGLAALSRGEYLSGLAAAGFCDAAVTLVSQAAPGMHSAIVKAVKPGA
jgi:hypothetical protein